MTIELYMTNSGIRLWYKNGKKHRLNGPAGVDVEGNSWWCYNGLIHKIDGPAFIWANGNKDWYVNGFKYDSYFEYLVAVEQYNLNK